MLKDYSSIDYIFFSEQLLLVLFSELPKTIRYNIIDCLDVARWIYARRREYHETEDTMYVCDTKA